VYLKPTGVVGWPEAKTSYMWGTAFGPEEIVAEWRGPFIESQGDLLRGPVTFDIGVWEVEEALLWDWLDGWLDETYYRWPYDLQVASHDFEFVGPTEGPWEAKASYTLTDAKGDPASEMRVDIIEPALDVRAIWDPAPTALGEEHAKEHLCTIDPHNENDWGDFWAVFCGADAHGAEQRDHQNRRLLPVNKEQAAPKPVLDAVTIHYHPTTGHGAHYVDAEYPYDDRSVDLRAVLRVQDPNLVWHRCSQQAYTQCKLAAGSADPECWHPTLPIDHTEKWPGAWGQPEFRWWVMVRHVTRLVDDQDNDRVLRWYGYQRNSPRDDWGWGPTMTFSAATGYLRCRVEYPDSAVANASTRVVRYPDPGGSDDPSQDDPSQALRLSVRRHLTLPPAHGGDGRPNDGYPDSVPYRYALVEWAYSYRVVPYEWGGGSYGWRDSRGATDSDPHDDSGENGDQEWGIDCNGLVNEAGSAAGYTCFGTRLNCTALASDTYTDAITWDQVRVGDILVKYRIDQDGNRHWTHVVVVRSWNDLSALPTRQIGVIESIGLGEAWSHPPQGEWLNRVTDERIHTVDEWSAGRYVPRRLRPPAN